ncbi:hypothetical protein [Pedobacter polysacchareus]|uniref:hypothetical protein n=1 Tax=Pedobacter polysacchareus TaxID=2861973 RepID=UPI001C9971CE|nr:hypothetical protein [Pedobacter polysacchareus]
MYFLTLQDPDYMVKGSRDPLGFQVLWQAAGRQLIPCLSTVSISIRDFQLMSVAQYCKEKYKISDRDYGVFFTCLEQLMAYSRFNYFKGDDSFNGIDRVRKVLSDNRTKIQIGEKFQLLSNQRSYGIWGKYNRPFSDLGIADDKLFKQVQAEKLASNELLRINIELLIKCKGAEVLVSKEILEKLGTIFEVPSNQEKQCYIQYLLGDHFGGELLRLVEGHPELMKLNFYEKLEFLILQTTDVRFANYLKRLSHTEQVLSPLNRIFRHLQTKICWTQESINNNKFIDSCRNNQPLSLLGHIPAKLEQLLRLPNWELVMGLIEVNTKVCSNRGSGPWMTKTAVGLDVNRLEGGYSNDNYLPARDNDHGYFLDTWFSLYSQLTKA